MPIDFRTLVAPEHTAVVAMECQEAVIGAESVVPGLVASVSAVGLIDNLADLMNAAREAGARVVHCTFETRPDRRGQRLRTPMHEAIDSGPNRLLAGSAGARIVPALGPRPEDFLSPRIHGLTPFFGTNLDALLRNLDITTVIATGVSVNRGVNGLVLEAVTRGYRVVVPRDCVAGYPLEFAEAMLAHAFSAVATITTKDEIKSAWKVVNRSG
jgi:nicotinamidase-related amidase